MAALDADARRIFAALAEAAVPEGRLLPPPSARTLEAAEGILLHLGESACAGYRSLLTALELSSVPLERARFSQLSLRRRQQVLDRLNEAEATFWMVRAVTAPLKLARAAEPELAHALGAAREAHAPAREPEERWREQIEDARTFREDRELEVDVVVVGTGAGGAPLAKALAARGHAVLMLEEGGHFSRADFTGEALAMQQRLYRKQGLTFTVGNAFIPLPLGRTVGGTTTVNSGTCYRTPDDVLRRWQLELGLHELGPGRLDPYFERVEAMLGVAPAAPEVLGGVARVIARGCDALGYRHGPLHRNAPGCDAQGVCCFGCPTGAKRSTDVSYVPAALARGAQLIHHVKVRHVILEGGRAVGVDAGVVPPGVPERRLAVRAKAVVLACGALHTPALLMANGLGGASGQLGRNLTMHPAGYAWARFDEPIRGWAEVPQGYAVEEFEELGIRFEGGFLPLTLAGGTFARVGRDWTELMERFDQLACFGFMIRESSRGRVIAGRDGEPVALYRVNDADLATLARAQAALARIFLAAGALEVYPGVQRFGPLRDQEDVVRFEREAPRLLRARHHDLTAYHPLGTCRMGGDPRRSVIGPSHELWDVERLFVVDGAAVPGPLGVNPQVTIMALSERAAGLVERRLEAPASGRRPGVRRRFAFAETMRGALNLAGRSAAASFSVRAFGELDLTRTLRERGQTLELEGTLSIDGLARTVPCAGTLRLRPLAPKANVTYDLGFTADDGARHTLHGEKHAPGLSPLGMLRLYAEVRREGELIGRGELRFLVRDVPRLASSLRLEPRVG